MALPQSYRRYLFRTPLSFVLLITLLPIQGWTGSLYLPLHMSPEIEARIDELFLLANMPIIKRPIPVKRVYDAMSKIENSSPRTVSRVRTYMKRYEKRASITHANVSLSHSDSAPYQLANQRGTDTKTSYQASFQGQIIISDTIAVGLGGMSSERVNNQKSNFYDGSYIALGTDYIQMDLGFRPHWLGPFQDSDMLLSTNAAAMPGITLSNVSPLPFLGIQYEVFMAKMSRSVNGIESAENPDSRLTGNPRLFGIHLSFQPLEGFAIGFNRLMQYGGADRDDDLTALANAFFNPKDADNIGDDSSDLGNQLSSITTRYTFTGKTPISLYMEYAGEDTSASSDVHLGNSALMIGAHIPQITDSLSFTYESAEWQNAWYVNSNYSDGLMNYHSIMGHWGANHRPERSARGASTHSAKLIWYIDSGTSLTTNYRRIENENPSPEIQAGEEVSLELSHEQGRWITGVTLRAGEDIYGEQFAQISAFVRY